MAYRKVFPKVDLPRTPNLRSNNTSLTHAEWEVAVFDEADQFLVVSFNFGQRNRKTFKSLSRAMAFCKDRPRSVLYANNSTGGHGIMLDRDYWDHWMKRWRGNLIYKRDLKIKASPPDAPSV